MKFTRNYVLSPTDPKVKLTLKEISDSEREEIFGRILMTL